MNERIYPADYTLAEWLELRKEWHDPKGDTQWWYRAQCSALGPNIAKRRMHEVDLVQP